MKKTILLTTLFVFVFINLGKTQILTIKGQVLDSMTHLPIPYANIGIPKLSIGTSSNENGEFVFKIDKAFEKDTFVCSSIGYISFKMVLNKVKNHNSLFISLKASDILLGEVVIKPIDVEKIMAQVIEKRAVNYGVEPVMMEGFYREYVKERDTSSYIVHSEGILEMYKSSVKKNGDRVRLIKGRQRDFNKIYRKGLNTYEVPFITNGPQIGILMDIIKVPESFISLRKQYKFQHEGYEYIQDKIVYIISFKPKHYIRDNENVSNCGFYKGRIYIDTASLALVRADYFISDNGFRVLNFPGNPLGLMSRHFTVNYSLFREKWYIQSAFVKNNYVYSKNIYEYLKKNTLNLDNKMELYITKIDTENVHEILRKEVIKEEQTLIDKILVSDDSFWGDFNFIKDIND